MIFNSDLTRIRDGPSGMGKDKRTDGKEKEEEREEREKKGKGRIT